MAVDGSRRATATPGCAERGGLGDPVRGPPCPQETRVARINEHYLQLKSSYLFTEIARRVKAFQAAQPGAKIIRLGIGDVTQPLPPAVVRALHAAVDEMARAE